MSEDNLEEKCLKLLDCAAKEALKSQAFTQIKLSTVERILKRETLNVREMDVYKACIMWAEAECSRQQIEVNFLKSFLCHVSMCLSDEDWCDNFLYIN